MKHLLSLAACLQLIQFSSGEPLGVQWRLTKHSVGSGSGLLSLASDGTKLRLIDSTSVYTADLAGRSLRASVSLGSLQDIAYANNLWVIVGNQGRIFTSPDGNSWEKQNTPTAFTLSEVAGGDDGWIALVEGRAEYLHSTDGQTWTLESFGESFFPHRIEWGGGKWIAADSSRTSLSADGFNWSSPTSPGGKSICWTGSRWLLLDGSSVKSSTSGDAWSTLPGNVVFSNVVAGHQGDAVTVGAFGKTYREGASGWMEIDPIQEDELLDIIWTGSHFVAAGHGSLVVSSPEGQVWRVQGSNLQDHFTRVSASPQGFVAISSGTSAFFSNDGVNWKQSPGILKLGLSDVAWCSDHWCAVGGSSIWTSPDGLQWSERYPTDNGTLYSVASNGQTSVAVGNNGVILIKDSTRDWEAVSSPTTSLLRRIEWGGGWFVACGSGSVVARSNDGVTWTSSNSGIEVVDLAWTGSEFVGVGRNATMVTSPDGASWNPVSTPGSEHFRAVVAFEDSVLAFAFSDSWKRAGDGGWSRIPDGGNTAASADGVVVVMGNLGFISTSSDGDSWTVRTGSAGGNPIARGAGIYVGCNRSGFVTTSETGEVWTTRPTGTDAVLEDVCWGPEGFMAVGQNGTICRSEDGNQWDVSTLPGNPPLTKVQPYLDGYLAISETGMSAFYQPGSGWQMGQLTVPFGTPSPRSLATGPSSAVCVTFNDFLLSSSDGLTWETIANGESNVVWDGSRFISSSSAGVSTSPDGIDWDLQDTTFYPRGYWHLGPEGSYLITRAVSGNLVVGTLVGHPDTGWHKANESFFGSETSFAHQGQIIVAGFNQGTAVSGMPRWIPFNEWATAAGIPSDSIGFAGDTNGDGISDGITYLYGAAPGTDLTPDRSVRYQAVVTIDGHLTFEIRRPWPSPEDASQSLRLSETLSNDWQTVLFRDRTGWQSVDRMYDYSVSAEGEWEIIRIPVGDMPTPPHLFLRTEAQLQQD